MVVRVDVAPELLRWATERAGWDSDTTRRRAPKFDEWEAGTHRPILKQLQKFARETHTPFGMLFLPEPPIEALPIPDMRTIGDRAVAQPSADLLDTIYLCQERQNWYRAWARDNGIPEPDFVGSASLASRPETVAADIRDRLSFGLSERGAFASWQEALRRLIDRIENSGVLVMVSGIVGLNTRRPLDPEEFRGFALSDPIAPLIFVNGGDTKAAQIFTLIHELAHIWLGRSALSDASMAARDAVDEERWCNQVAAEVLVPRDALTRDFSGDADTDELERLARRYRVSTLVVLMRLFDIDRLPWADFRRRYEAERERVAGILAARQGDRSGGNFYLAHPLRLSRTFARAVISSAHEGTTPYRDAYQLVGTKSHDTFENLADQLGVG